MAGTGDSVGRAALSTDLVQKLGRGQKVSRHLAEDGESLGATIAQNQVFAGR